MTIILKEYLCWGEPQMTAVGNNLTFALKGYAGRVGYKWLELEAMLHDPNDIIIMYITCCVLLG